MNELIQKYLNYLNLEKGLSINTIFSYQNDLSQFENFCNEKKINNLNEINQKHISDFIKNFYDLGLTPKSIARKISSIKSFLNFLLESGKIKNNPFAVVDLPKIAKKLPTVLSLFEIEKILNSIKISKNIDIPMHLRDRAIVETLYATGIRISELISLSMRDVFFDEGIIRVFGKGSVERIVPIGEPALNSIKKYIQEVRTKILKKKIGSEFVFLNFKGKSLSRMGVWNIINEAVKNSGIKQNIHPHTFRHTFATHLIEGGADLRSVQEMLGHAKISTTEIYTHIDRSLLKTEHQKYHPRG